MKVLIPFFYFLIFSIHSLYAQEILVEKEIDLLNYFNTSYVEYVPIVESRKDKVALYITNNNNIYSYHIDKADNSKVETFSVSIPDKKINNLLGCNIDTLGHHYFFTDRKKNHFLAKSLLNNNSKEVSIPIKLKGESI